MIRCGALLFAVLRALRVLQEMAPGELLEGGKLVVDEWEGTLEVLDVLREASGFDERTAVVTAVEACSLI
jgi:hypothetical protein